jgi:glycosyltransferase involved in cell wall biosynthesis
MTCSVLLPVYNGGVLLRLAVDSILKQDDPDFELLLIDDCSTDGSAQIIRRYAASDVRIRAIYHRRNAGLAGTLNEGLAEARTDLVVRMDQDDVALAGRVGAQVTFMRERPEVAVAGTFVYHMGASPAYDHLVQLPTGHDEIVSTLQRENCIYHPSVIMRRQQILSLGGYRPEFRNSEDYDLWLRVARVSRLANLPEPLLRYRFSVDGMTLGRKWEQALYTRMAVISNRDPERSLDEVRQEAAMELERQGKGWFLEQVARGTILELIRLRLAGQAWRVLWTFSRQLDRGRVLPLVRDFAAALLRTYLPGTGEARA